MSAALPVVADAIDLALALTQALAQIMPVIEAANASGATVLTADQWATITGNETSAEALLTAAIAAAKAKGQ